MNQAAKRYTREFTVTMIAYTVVIIASSLMLNDLEASPWHFPIALLPIIPVVFMIMAFMRYLAAIDELQQKIQLQAIGFAAGTTGLLTFAYGFLELVGFPQFSIFLVFPMIIMLWGLGLAFFTRRYQ